MRLKNVTIRNYRSFRDTTVELDGYSCFVGANGAGKSSILTALNILFRESSNPTNVATLTEEDFHFRNTEQPIEISVTFCDLTEDAKTDLADYVRQDELTITARATWDESRLCAEVMQYGSRMVMPQFAPFFEAATEGRLVKDLVPIYEKIRSDFPELEKIKTKVGMKKALREYEENHPDLCRPHESSDQFYGWSKGANRLAPHVQWVFIPAVKDASEEEAEGRATALGLLLQRTIRSRVDFTAPISDLKRELEKQYQEIIAEHREVLGELSERIQKRLKEWSHPGAVVELDWSYDPDRSLRVEEPVAKATLGEGGFRGALARLGHGLQRSFLVALLTEVASTEAEGQPTLVLGFEEPELYQHPPQARHLATVLEQLAGRSDQVLVTTHSPYFVSGHGFESIRMTSKDPSDGVSRVASLSHDRLSESLAAALDDEPAPASEMLARVEQIMQPSRNEMFFSRLPVLVEGPEDVAYITTQLHLRGEWPDFRRFGGHFIVCGGKTNLSRPLAIAEGLGMPAFVLFDGDFDEGSENESQHRRDNSCILRLAGYPKGDPWSAETLWERRLIMFSPCLATLIRQDVEAAVWDDAKSAAKERMGISGKLSPKNTLWIAATLEELRERDIQVQLLDEVCLSILDYGRALEGS